MKSLLQTDLWAEFKSRHGWIAHRLAGYLFLERSLALGQRFLYAPELSINFSTEVRNQTIQRLIEVARKLGRERNAFLVRLEFFEEYSDEKAAVLSAFGLKKAFEEVQPEWRQWIDLRSSQAQILAQMKPKGRYNIRLSEKSKVQVRTETNPEIFWQLLVETARRDGFSIRKRDYYADLIETLTKTNHGELLVAYSPSPVFASPHQPQPLAAALIAYSDGLASYLYGASSSAQRQLMAPYALHWTAMKKAQARGCHTYDLLAIAPQGENSEFEIRNSKLQTKYAGLTRFKAQFGGRAVHLLGAWDFILKPLVYPVFRWLELRRRT